MLKHRIKLLLRGLYARVLFHTGLHAVVSRLLPPRVTVLAGHCVAPDDGSWPGVEHLPPDMTISSRRLAELVRWFQRRYEIRTIGDAARACEGGAPGRSILAISMDDGYRDNHAVMLPLLRELGVPATVFLESRPLDERRVNWSHKFFWLTKKLTLEGIVHRYGELAPDDPGFHAMNQTVAEGRPESLYTVKRALKYDADPAARDRALDAMFAEEGGDEGALCDALYMTWDEAREMAAAGVELGGHTVGHPILSRLDGPQAEREIGAGADAMERELGSRPETFAYPWGRPWDFDDASREGVRKAGFRTAVIMRDGVNGPDTDPLAWNRIAIDDTARLHLIVAEACGGFELAKRLGLDLRV